ncbi:MAG: tRNA pseudouridine(55) synthase TruB [Oscillospiraceae bacterium]|nr:tRNA pseudouridine(55) synthase TruB [Oscillospiraceae bacterium]
MNGILCMNKPKDFTSFDVIAKLRGILKIRRLGHSGTLDPMATGVLPVFIGTATKACDMLPDNEKSYRAEFRLGVSSDTQDSTGKITAKYDIRISESQILDVLPSFMGNIMQTPPMYSAVQIDGKRLYDLARKGIEVERKKREITINEIRLESFDEKSQTGTLFISCSKGTYIRTIINDIGDALKCGGIMTSLVRLSSSGFTLDKCFTFEQVQNACNNGSIEDLIIPVEYAFRSLPEIKLNQHQTKLYKNGVKLDLSRINNISDDINIYRIYGFDGHFIGTALTDKENNILRVDKNLA